MRPLILICIALVCLPTRAETLLQTDTTWEGGAIIYPAGRPEVTSVKLRIEPGQDTPFHCHPVPTLGYVLSGTVEVETSGGKRARFSQGQSVVEVLRTLHRGTAIDGTVEIIVFYAGARDTPTTVLPADDPQGRYCQS